MQNSSHKDIFLKDYATITILANDLPHMSSGSLGSISLQVVYANTTNLP